MMTHSCQELSVSLGFCYTMNSRRVFDQEEETDCTGWPKELQKRQWCPKKRSTGKWKYVLNLAHTAMEKCIKPVLKKTWKYLNVAVIQTLFAVEEEENKPANFPVSFQKGKEDLGIRAS